MKDLEGFYKDHYKLLEKAIRATSKLIKSFIPLDENQKRLIKKIKNTRQELTKFFNHPEIIRCCRKCHLNSKEACCKTTREERIPARQDLIYILANNPDFELPKPDIEFLISISNDCPACISLGKEGCLLKENRPIVCLDHYCDRSHDSLSFVLDRLSLKEKLRENLRILNRASLALVQSICEQTKK